MKPETIVNILESSLGIDTVSAKQLYHDLPEWYFDEVFFKVPLEQLNEYIEIIKPEDFSDNFESIQDYKEFKDSCIHTKVVELDGGCIAIINI